MPPLPRLERPTARLAVLLVVVAVAADLARRGPVASIGVAVLPVVLVGALLASGRVRNPRAWAVALVVPAVAAVLALRAQPWLIGAAVVVGAAAVWVVAALAQRGSVLDLGLRWSGLAVERSALAGARAPAFAGRAFAATVPDRVDRRHLAGIGRGLLLAVPVVVVVGALLVSGDAVLASVVRVPGVDVVVEHAFWLVAGVLVGAMVLVEASSEPVVEGRPGGPRLGRTEAGVVLGGLVVVLGAFAAVQVVAATGGAEHVLRTAGLTYAEYAREGFFQLLGAAGITLAVLWAVQALVRPGPGRGLAVVGEAAVGLTLVVVGVALWRLHLYDEAFGLTIPRYAAMAAAWWLAALFVAVGLAHAGVGAHRRWLGGVAVALFVVALLAVAVDDPAASVAERNLARARAGATLDTGYLVGLGDDAVPVIAAALPSLPADQRDAVRAALCAPTRRPPDPVDGPAWNGARAAAVRARAEVCDR